jgi:polyadenylate-binding protein
VIADTPLGQVSTTETGSSRGYGFVDFASEESAKTAVDAMDGKVVEDQSLSVAKFVPRSQRLDNTTVHFTNVYLRGFPHTMPDNDVLVLFANYGKVTSYFFGSDRENRRFLCANLEAAEAAAKARRKNRLCGVAVILLF